MVMTIHAVRPNNDGQKAAMVGTKAGTRNNNPIPKTVPVRSAVDSRNCVKAVRATICQIS